MAETKRPFWKVKRFWGAVFGITGAVFATVPGAPVIASIGVLAITTQTVATITTGLGVYVFGYGQGSAKERNKR